MVKCCWGMRLFRWQGNNAYGWKGWGTFERLNVDDAGMTAVKRMR